MATKKPAPTEDELLAQLDELSKPKTTKSSTRAPRQGNASQTEQDLLAELGSLAQRPSSRSGTPSLRPNAPPSGARSPMRDSNATPPPGRTSEEKSNNGQRRSGDSARSYHQAFTPATTATEESPELESVQASTPAPAPAPASSGGWWGGLISTATAAVSQAQAAVKEIQKTEEAQKWTDQLKGNIGMLKGYGMFP